MAENIVQKVGGWSREQVLSFLAQTALTVVGVSFFAWLAKISAFLQAWAPLSYVAAGLSLLLVIAAIRAINAYAKAKRAAVEFEERRSTALNVNPLESNFRRIRIKLQDFFHPYSRPTVEAVFEDCELFGPSNIFINGGSIKGGGFKDCDIITIEPGDNKKVFTGMEFRDCTFNRCDFYKCMILMTPRQYQLLRAAIPNAPPPLTGPVQ